MKRLLLAVSAAALMSGAAHAADAVYEELPVAIEVDGFTWTGGYVGAQIGYAWANTEVRDIDDYPFALNGQEYIDFNSNGIAGGIYAGYNWQFDQIVVGIEAEITAADINKTVPNTWFDDPDESFSNELNWFGTLRGRVGYSVDRFLPYVTAGAAFADIRSSYNDPDDYAVVDDIVWGWTIGAGVNYAVTDNWILKAEYLYVDLADKTAWMDDEFSFEFNNTFQTVRVGAAYKF